MSGTNQTHTSPQCPILYVEWLKSAMQRAFDVTYENLKSSFHKQKKYHDVKLKPRKFEVGDKVLRWYPPQASQKLGLGWVGPYIITRKLSNITYEIQECQSQTTKVVYVDHLKLFQMRQSAFSESNENIVTNHSDSEDIFDTNDLPSVNETCPTDETIQASPRYTRRGRLIKPPKKFSP